MSETEKWLSVPGHDNYEVSNCGRVRSYNHSSGIRQQVPSLLKPHTDKRGYSLVCLCNKGKIKGERIHRLVLSVFSSQPENNGLHAAHKDGDATNNNLSNLYWATAKQNTNDKWRHGTMPIGEQTNSVKLTEYDVKKIRRLARLGMTGQDISLEYPVSHHTVCRIINRVTWKHI